jgi:hypothetical protein
MAIQKEFPELMKFLNEMPVTIPIEGSPEINRKVLQEYFDSLEVMRFSYASNHTILINNL